MYGIRVTDYYPPLSPWVCLTFFDYASAYPATTERACIATGVQRTSRHNVATQFTAAVPVTIG